MKNTEKTACRIFLALGLLSFLACEPSKLPDFGRATHPIVNGTTTSGWPAVGALVYDSGGYWGHFCTGTLINSQWVLTAAHCVDYSVTEIQVSEMSFYVGPDANSPSGGSTYPAAEGIIHNGWNGSGGNDIALIRLASAVPSGVATPIPYNTYNLSNYSNNPVRWVGYGISDGYSGTGGGIKRTATGDIDNVYSTDLYYGVGDNSAMPCSGDSGGATLMNIDGLERLVGVISRGDEHCVSGGIDTRVDAYASWIAENAGGASSCAITGGDCSSGEACYLTTEGGFSCFPTEGRQEGQACNPEIADMLRCADGLVCIGSGTSGTCLAFCEFAADCDFGESCAHFTDLDFGYCACTDVDNDGHCADVDCDDNNPNVHPGAAEICGDGIDNDCDGQTDEGCCQDRDGDGYDGYDPVSCPGGTDCDDTNNTVNPGQAEVCGNGFDDDCDGLTDEGCGGCTDADGDGYCADIDCDDHDSTTYPGAPERCGDGRDNDCDGLTDESCGNCVSVAECDDGNPCTADACVAGACVYEDEPDGMACGENMMCQIGECFPAGDGGGSDGCATAGGASSLSLWSLLWLGLAWRRRAGA